MGQVSTQILKTKSANISGTVGQIFTQTGFPVVKSPIVGEGHCETHTRTEESANP